jgi:hypothetical protein
MRLEQAIFTSVRGGRLEGYQLAAASPGITPQLARELTIWGPAHDSLWDTRRDARSVNFHPLMSGGYCLSCTTIAGAEYSGRGGGRVYTQMFVVPAELLARFANDAFLVLRALAASGRLVVLDEVPPELSSVPLLGRCDAADPTLMSQILDEVGQDAFGELAGAIANAPAVAVLTSGHVERLFEAVLWTFSVSERQRISFTTGLKESSRRPFRLCVLPADPAIVRQSQRQHNRQIIDLAANSRLSTSMSG